MGVLKVWDGTAWQFISAASDGASVYVGPEAPPGTPDTGDMWFDSDQDGTTGTTLPLTIANGGTGATAAAAARSSLAVPGIGQSGSTAGAPTTGTWARGDQWLDSANILWLCTTGGTPGTWITTMQYSNGAFVDFVPSFNSGITAIGNATYWAKYKRLGDKTVWFTMRLNCGSTTTFSSGVIQMNAPYGTFAPTNGQTVSCGTCQLNLSNVFVGVTRVESATGFTIAAPITPTSSVATTGVLGSTLTTTSGLLMSAIYEIV